MLLKASDWSILNSVHFDWYEAICIIVIGPIVQECFYSYKSAIIIFFFFVEYNNDTR